LTRNNANNFDLIRLVLACTVVFHHLDYLSRAPAFQGLRHWFSGALAVQAFFVISGFLVYQSYEKSKSALDYFEKRVRRLYPAYVSTVVFFGVVFAMLAPAPALEYLMSWPFLRYLAYNLLFLNFKADSLPGILTTNPLPEVNGALWTIKVEVMFYLCVPLIASTVRKIGQWRTCSLLFAFAAAYCWLFTSYSPNPSLQKQLPGQLGYFAMGILICRELPRFLARARWMVPVAVVAFVISRWEVVPMLRPISVGILVCAAAYGLPYLGNAGRYGDLSYGIYIVHFPVIQLFEHYRWFEPSAWLGCLGCWLAVLAIALASWHLVEKRFLQRSSHYLQQATGRQLEGRPLR
jgi:peptidoglycan/LPS O-acetylase OafA/YrhL